VVSSLGRSKTTLLAYRREALTQLLMHDDKNTGEKVKVDKETSKKK
jgi:hypothetical protein